MSKEIDISSTALPRYIPPARVAAVLGLPERIVRRMLKDGRLPVPFIRIGRRLQVNEEALRQWLQDREIDSQSRGVEWKEGY